mgnify:CR=1 FL=1
MLKYFVHWEQYLKMKGQVMQQKLGIDDIKESAQMYAIFETAISVKDSVRYVTNSLA